MPLFELAFLNSSIGWFLLSSLARIKRGGFIEAEAQYVGQLPSLSAISDAEGKSLSGFARTGDQSRRKRDLKLQPRSGIEWRIYATQSTEVVELPRKAVRLVETGFCIVPEGNQKDLWERRACSGAGTAGRPT